MTPQVAAPVRIEGFNPPPKMPESQPVIRRNPASFPTVLEQATALKVENNADSQRQLAEMMARLKARKAGSARGRPVPLLPAAVTTGGTPPIFIMGRSESTDSLPSDRSEHGWSTGSVSAAAAPGWQASGWCETDRAGGSPASVSPSSTSPPTPPQKKSVPPSPLSRDCRNAPSSASSPDMNPHLSPMPAYKTIEEVVTKRQIVCDNCERQCSASPVDTKTGVFCSGECQWSANFARRDLRQW